MPYIRVYRDKIPLLFTIVGALASVLGAIIPLVRTSENVQWWIILLLIVFGALTILGFVIAFKSGPLTRVYRSDDKQQIMKYMFRWIKSGGRVAIWTRDMSWAEENNEIFSLLVEKAEKRELIVCLPMETDFTKHLRKHGAEVVVYGALDAPSNSFTFANFGRQGSRVAVAIPDGDKHIIQEISSSNSPTFQIAQDLVKLVRANNDG